MANNITTTATAATPTLDQIVGGGVSLLAMRPNEREHLQQFAWLIDNLDGRSVRRLIILWGWAAEMARFQDVANRTGKPVEYFQRGEVLRVLYPQNVQEAAQ